EEHHKQSNEARLAMSASDPFRTSTASYSGSAEPARIWYTGSGSVTGKRGRRMKTKVLLLAGVSAGATLGFVMSAAALEVTAQRLLNAQSEPQNWLLPYGSYDA